MPASRAKTRTPKRGRGGRGVQGEEYRAVRASGERSEPISHQGFARNAFGLFSEHTTKQNKRLNPLSRLFYLVVKS